jgi:hypothetical protein
MSSSSESYTNDERLDYAQLHAILNNWKTPRFMVPMCVTLPAGPKVLKTLSSYGISYQDWTDPGDDEVLLLVDLGVDTLSILANFSSDDVYFQTPDVLVSAVVQ